MADKKISALTGATTPLAGSEVLPIVQGGATVKVSVNNLTAGKAVSANSLNVNSPSLVQQLTVTGTLSGNDAADSGMAILRAGTTFGSNLYHTYSTKTFSDAFGVTVNDNTTLTDPQYTKYLIGSNGIHIWFGGTTATEFGRFDTSGNLKATIGNVVIGTAGKGIDFSANTHAAGMTSELLNDYEEGTFTATLTGSSTAPTTPVTATAYYTKIGRLVTCNILFSSVDTTGASGAILISGLPFTPALIRSVGACNMGGMGAVAAVSIVSSGTTTMEIWDATQVNNILISAGAGKTVNTTISYLV